MHGADGKRWRWVWAVILAFMASGCAEFGDVPAWMPFQQAAEQVPGVEPPAERIAALRKLADSAPQHKAEEKQRISEELAASIRGEEDPMIRMEILRALGRYPSEAADAVLRAASSDPDRDVRALACQLWGERGGPEAISLLSGALTGDLDVDVRLAAARALGEIKDPAAAAALGEVLADPDPAMQRRAVLSLRRITGEDFGNDVGRWQQYVRGEKPGPTESPSLAERLRRLF